MIYPRKLQKREMQSKDPAGVWRFVSRIIQPDESSFFAQRPESFIVETMDISRVGLNIGALKPNGFKLVRFFPIIMKSDTKWGLLDS